MTGTVYINDAQQFRVQPLTFTSHVEYRRMRRHFHMLVGVGSTDSCVMFHSFFFSCQTLTGKKQPERERFSKTQRDDKVGQGEQREEGQTGTLMAAKLKTNLTSF